jgi:predicted GNAT superfamily acetyltransferase
LKYRDATTFKSILNEYGKDGEVLGLVVGYSGEASSAVYRVEDLVATRIASKHLEHARTPKSIAKGMRTQRICRAWGHSFARGFARVILDRVRDNLDQAPDSRNWGSELLSELDALTPSSTFIFYPPSAGEGRS